MQNNKQIEMWLEYQKIISDTPDGILVINIDQMFIFRWLILLWSLIQNLLKIEVLKGHRV